MPWLRKMAWNDSNLLTCNCEYVLELLPALRLNDLQDFTNRVRLDGA